MRRLHLLTMVVAGLLVAADEPKKELQGNWTLVSLEVDGKKATQGEVKQEQKLVVEGDKFNSTVDDKHSFKGAFKLDPNKRPKTVDAAVAEGNFKGKTLLGIYEIDGEGLRACYASPGKDRPLEFSSKAGSGNYLYTYKRDKP